MIGFKKDFLSWVKYLVPDQLEQDPPFRGYLARLSRIGMIVVGILAAVGVGLVVTLTVVIRGREVVLIHGLPSTENAVSLWDKLIIIALGFLCILLSRIQVGAETRRYAVWVLMIGSCFMAVLDDVIVGDVDSTAGYLILFLMSAVAAIPFRPWQVTMMGTTVILVFIFQVKIYPGGLNVPDNFYAQMVPTTVLATVITCYLYQARHRLYRARQKEISLKNSIAETAKELLLKHSELQETQAQLVQSEKMAALGNLVAGVAHEINSPLGAIGANADTAKRALDLIRRGLEDDSPRSREKTRITIGTLASLNDEVMKAAERIDNIVTALRNFACLDEGEYQSFNLNQGIEDTLTLVMANPQTEIEVVKDLCPLGELYCRPRLLNQVFINILNNAVEAVTDNGRVTVSTREIEGRVRVQIIDNGRGILPEHIEHVFEPGFTTKGRGVGTGLGLAICYRIIEEHGGVIGVASAPAEGTTVTIELPFPSPDL